MPSAQSRSPRPGIAAGIILAWTRAVASSVPRSSSRALSVCARPASSPVSRTCSGSTTRTSLSLGMWIGIEGGRTGGVAIGFVLLLLSALSVLALMRHRQNRVEERAHGKWEKSSA